MITQLQQKLGAEFTVTPSKMPGAVDIKTPYSYPDSSNVFIHYQLDTDTLTDLASVSAWASHKREGKMDLNEVFDLLEAFFLCRGYEVGSMVIYLPNVQEDSLAEEINALGKYIQQFCSEKY